MKALAATPRFPTATPTNTPDSASTSSFKGGCSLETLLSLRLARGCSPTELDSRRTIVSPEKCLGHGLVAPFLLTAVRALVSNIMNRPIKTLKTTNENPFFNAQRGDTAVAFSDRTTHYD
eukprot:scaffold2360_cov62-Phaeocystis_antarctica.AAC.6